jgi:transposase-like protein
MRAVEQLTFNPAQSWRILQHSKEGLFEDLDELMQRNYQHFLEELMLYERQRFLNAAPYQRHEERTDQANGFYTRSLVTRAGRFDALRVPRTRSGLFQTQVLDRYARRDALVNQLLRQVFLAGVSTRQTGATLAALLDESVSAATVSEVCKVLDDAVATWHRVR